MNSKYETEVCNLRHTFSFPLSTAKFLHSNIPLLNSSRERFRFKFIQGTALAVQFWWSAWPHYCRSHCRESSQSMENAKFGTPKATSDLIKPAVWIQVLFELWGLTLGVTRGSSVWVNFYSDIGHVCFCCVALFLLKAKPDKSDSTPENDLITLTWGRESSMPSNQISQNKRKLWAVVNMKKGWKHFFGYDWWPLCFQCKPELLQKVWILFRKPDESG